MSIVIGIAGKKHSGKDTVAGMIAYMFRVGLAQANYYDWAKKKDAYTHDRCIIHFADKLKDYCSEIFNIPREYFDNTEYKDDYLWSITNQEFIKRTKVYTDVNEEITIDSLVLNELCLMDTRRWINTKGKVSLISLRTIMQYIGTNIFRNLISKDMWIDICINKAKQIETFDRCCIIPDVRFYNEAMAIKSNFTKSTVIEIRRDTGIEDSHESENIDFQVDTVIDNNGTPMALFYKILTYLNELVK